MTPPAAARVVLHVGLPKTGTTYLQSLLGLHREQLRDVGVLYPFVGPQAMFLGAVEVRGSHDKFGLGAEEVAGTWQALCDRVLAHGGTSIISHEILGGAEPAEIEAALAPLAGAQVDIVVTARDLGRQATAHWQEEVKLGDPRSFADFERDQYLADTPIGAAGTAPSTGRPHFWHAQDYAAALARWKTAVPASRVHLVVCPPPGAPSELLWTRFAAGCGLDQDQARVVDPRAVPPANASLGTTAIALVRALDARLAGRLTPREHARVVKRQLAEGRLAGHPDAGPPPRTPARLADVLVPASERWAREVRAGGHPVHGELADLTPVLAAEGEPDPDQVADSALVSLGTALLADDVLREVAALRVDSGHGDGEVDGQVDGTGTPAGDRGDSPPARGAVERLRRRLQLHRD